MNTRPTRSSSIPIPRSSSASSARNIESLISISFVPPGRNQPVSPSSRPIPGPRRISTQDGRAGVNPTHGSSTSPRSTSTFSSVPGRSTSRTRFEPRVVRSSTTDGADAECPPSPSTSPSHTRRTSHANLRTTASLRPIIPQHIVSRTAPVSFPRPPYLDNSSLRHLLHTEIPIHPIPSRRADPTSSSRNQVYANALSTTSDRDDDTSTAPSPLTLESIETSFKLPTRWSDQDRHSGLSLSPEGRELTLHGPSPSGEKDASSARTTHSIPPACGIFYYEVEILGKEQKSHISIGFSGKSARFAKLPGYEPSSWAYYGEDGSALSPERLNVHFQHFGTGDTIGCGVDFTTYKAFFTKNGVLLGHVFESVGQNVHIHPSIGLQHMGDSIRANFGQEPFKYDIEDHVQRQRNATWNKILGTPIDRSILRGHQAPGTDGTADQSPLSDDESKQVLNELIMSYLIHHGHVKTARAFKHQRERRDTKGPDSSKGDGCDDVYMSNGSKKADVAETDIALRTSIVNDVLAGNMDKAIDSLHDHYPTVLEVDKQLIFFKLRFRKFVELILVTTDLKKKMKAMKGLETQRRKLESKVEPSEDSWMVEDIMDVDEDAAPFNADSMLLADSHSSWYGHDKHPDPELNEINSQYEAALNIAILYGQTLSNDFHSDPRPELQQLFRKTFGIVAWEDPLEEGSGMADIVGNEPRIALALEINQAILKSQGCPEHPPLETLYRHTATCITLLGVLGVGSAAFADMPREFLQ